MRTTKAGLAVCAAVLLASGPAAAEVTTNVSNDVTGLTVFVPCANGGGGETVVFEGRLHVLAVVTLDNKGGFHLKSHSQPQGLTGTGQVTGDKYQGTGVTQDQLNGKVGETYTYVNNFRIIGPGPGNNYLVHTTSHYTVNANGELAVEHVHSTSTCK